MEHLITATDTFIRRLTREEKEQIFAESITWFERYGVSARGTPRTYAEFERYFEHALEERLVAHRTASYGVGYATKGWPRPDAGPAPGLVAGPATRQRDELLADHRWAAAQGREILGLPWDAAAGAALPAVRAGVPRAGPPLPRRCPARLRIHPIPLRAFRREGRGSDAIGVAPSRLGAWPTARPWDCSTPTR